MAVARLKMHLNADKLINIYAQRGKKGIDKALSVLKVATEANTPEDTGEMVSSYNIKPAEIKGDTVKGSLENTSEHALYVEYGVKGQRYNYHKPKGMVMYTGVGNQTFSRSLDSVQNELFSIISDSLGG